MTITSYVADVFKREDPPRLKRGSIKSDLCYLCTADCNTFPSSTNAELQTLSNTKLILEKHESASTKSKTESTLNKLSMLPVPPVHHTSSMVGVYSFLGIHAVLRVKPMLVLFHGV